ncbi:hypothetical protein WJX72_006013 [[Myrmecia] bisecta]|uniref:Pep3/Vps18 beta-propeller domain-containing protein n=1 Tax=[Myrmecia] bisecta TaxID=41462 RepID=A0AAW1Q178_9CHLO
MSLLDEWGAGETISGQEGFLSDEDGFEVVSSPTTGPTADAAMFSLETVERQIARGRGQVTAVAAASDSIVVGTSRAFLIRYDFSQGSAPVAELELSKAADASVRTIFVDPAGNHTLVALQIGAACETQYMHARWKKARVLNKLKGVSLTAVGWHWQRVQDVTTGEMLVGSEGGLLHEVVLEEKEKKEKSVKQVYSLGEAAQAICSVQQHPLPDGRLAVLLATPARLFVFVGAGTGSLEALFAAYPQPAAELTNCLEAPGSPTASQLQLFSRPGTKQAERFAWLAGSTIYHGSLAPAKSGLALGHELELLGQVQQLDVPPAGLPPPLTIISMAVTQFHIVLLQPAKLQAINHVSGQLAQEVPLTSRGGLASPGRAVGLTTDEAAGATYLVAGDGLYELSVHDEGRNMWRIYLGKQDYSNAFRNCRTQAQRDTVNIAEAEAAFSAGRLRDAARLYGKVTAALPSFEEVALKFVEVGGTEALQVFLQTKLDTLGHEDKAQATMVASWLTELYLDHINRALLEEAGEAAAAAHGLTEQLRAFLRANVDVLDVNVTISLLAGYGRMDDLMHYATYRHDNEAVVEYLMARGEASRALAVLRHPNVSQELFYKFAPVLMASAPRETVDAWMTGVPALDPRRLLPALMRFGEVAASAECQAEALRYVHHCIGRLQTTDPAVHNLAVALISLQNDEAELLEYLNTSRDLLGRPLYDPQFALRLARQRGRLQACVLLFCELAMYEDAVALALTFDLSLATAVAMRPEEEEALQRKLWLAIARDIISQQPGEGQDEPPGHNIKKINEFLREAGGLIKIEDILPLFPDFVQIDNFKDAICQSLEDYNQQIEHLKGEMEDATRIADALRRDMAALEQRTATLDLSEPCARCQRAVGDAPPASAGPSGGAVPRFYLFPSGNAFHGVCAGAEVMDLVAPSQRARIQTLLTRLSQVSEGADMAPALKDAAAERVETLRKQLDEQVAAEDPYCGETVIRNIDKPFIMEDEVDIIRSWEI